MAHHLTTHALDTVKGCGARGLRVTIRRLDPAPASFASFILDDRGRGVLIAGDDFIPGNYELTFDVAQYHRINGFELESPPFLERIIVQFSTQKNRRDYHVPILFNPYGYTTYRGD